MMTDREHHVSSTTESHYLNHSAESYENAYFYEPGPYQEYLVTLVQDRLQLLNKKVHKDDWKEQTRQQQQHTILDIGGGTGNFTRAMIKNTNVQAIVLDPYFEKLQQHSSDNNDNNNNNNTTTTTPASPASDDVEERIKFVKGSAQIFIPRKSTSSLTTTEEDSSSWRHNFQQVLMKEIIHHIPSQDRVAILKGIFRDLSSSVQSKTEVTNNSGDITNRDANHHDTKDDDINNNSSFVPRQKSLPILPPLPSILIITRPQLDIDYPLWDKARLVWAQHEPSIQDLMNDLCTAGFMNITYTTEIYPCSIPFNRWKHMVINRFWSTFTYFTDQELENACNEMEQNTVIDTSGYIHFEDRLLFITAT